VQRKAIAALYVYLFCDEVFSTFAPFRRHFLGDVRRDFMHRLSVVLHGTLGSYLRDALHDDYANVVARFLAPRAYARLLSPLLLVVFGFHCFLFID
jgi:hypothetical protein